MPLSAEYRLKGNDEIQLSVFGEPELSKQVRLTVSGEASLPLIGSVELGSLTLKEAEELVLGLYQPDYLISPQISINLAKAANERVTVMGAVRNPGQVHIEPDTQLDLVSAISSSGGLAPHAEPDRIELKRGDSIMHFTMERLGKKGEPPVILKHGDIINVRTNPYANKMVTILGEVNAPGQLSFPQTGELDLKTLIGMARDLTLEADSNAIKIRRDGKDYKVALNDNRKIRIYPGDIVTVPQSRFVGETVTIVGEVGRPGRISFPMDGKLDLLTAIAMAGGVDRLGNKAKVTVSRTIDGKMATRVIDLGDLERGRIPLLYLQPDDTVSVPVRRF
ncbi:MAG: SLBB domain-containing protein [Verrucomicrobiota bacterium JB023]|nr:SLBB domain-containing protein [Verrucomicrobiota bacterium JB023]